MMGESRVVVEQLLALCLQRIHMEEGAVSAELELVAVVRNFEAVRRRWLTAELELKKFKELLVKSDVAKAALEVKLKHARNQLDVEMKKRYKMEADYQYLQRQMQLMCDILVHDSKSSAVLNEEQKSLLATFEQRAGNVTLQQQQRSGRRLSVIDESSFLSHSDISYDRTDDDMDLDTTVIKPLRSRVREKRRSSMGPAALGVPVVRRGRNVSAELERRTVEKEVETIVKATVTTPEGGGHIHMVLGISQDPERPAQPLPRERCVSMETDQTSDQTSVWFPCEEPEAPVLQTSVPAAPPPPPPPPPPPCRPDRTQKHVFLSKTDSLEAFAPSTHPRVPPLVLQCVAEIERRGLEERGLYRVPGGERVVKELRDRFLQKKLPLQLLLGRVHDVHVLCGFLKDFLRRLKEPLLTFRLHRSFMEAAELADEDNSSAIMIQTVAELPKPNRDTLAVLILHLHRVARSPQCQMDHNNLSRVFGPTLVGHGMSEPSPTTIMRDTNTQPKVVCRLLSLPEDFWRRVLAVHTEQLSSKTCSQEAGHAGRLFQPLTSPELNSFYQMAGRGSGRGRTRNLGSNTGRVEPGRRFFTSPS